MITSLEIQNFRCLKDMKLPLQNINVIIGDNGSGKSSILEILWKFSLDDANWDNKVQEIAPNVLHYQSPYGPMDPLYNGVYSFTLKSDKPIYHDVLWYEFPPGTGWYQQLGLQSKDLVRLFFPVVQDISSYEDMTYIPVPYLILQDGSRVDMQHLSDNMLRTIDLIGVLTMPKEKRPQVLILEEPEQGISPRNFARLATLIKVYSEHTQVVLTTHSSSFMDKFNPEDIVLCNLDHQTNTTHIRRLSPDLLKGWIDRYTISELYQKTYFKHYHKAK